MISFMGCRALPIRRLESGIRFERNTCVSLSYLSLEGILHGQGGSGMSFPAEWSGKVCEAQVSGHQCTSLCSQLQRRGVMPLALRCALSQGLEVSGFRLCICSPDGSLIVI